MKNNLYIWFLIGVASCCLNAYVFGRDGNWVNGAATIVSFLLYSRTAFWIHRRRKFQLLLEERRRNELRQ